MQIVTGSIRKMKSSIPFFMPFLNPNGETNPDSTLLDVVTSIRIPNIPIKERISIFLEL